MLYTEFCKGYLESVMERAKARGVQDRLKEKLEYLGTYACHGNPTSTVCVLSSDLDDSFGFTMYRRTSHEPLTVEPVLENWSALQRSHFEYWFNGGLIHYGPRESGVGGPQFSVRLTTSDEEEWLVNT